jgi:hypothetical protein
MIIDKSNQVIPWWWSESFQYDGGKEIPQSLDSELKMEAANAQESFFKFHPLRFLIFVFADVEFVSY